MSTILASKQNEMKVNMCSKKVHGTAKIGPNKPKKRVCTSNRLTQKAHIDRWKPLHIVTGQSVARKSVYASNMLTQ